MKSHDLLRLLAKYSFSNKEIQYIKGITREKLLECDWKWIFDTSNHHRIAPLLYYNFKRSGILRYLPKKTLNDFQNNFSLHTLRFNSYKKEITPLQKKFREIKKDVYLIKGIDTVNRVYNNSFPRPFGDTDFVIKKKDIKNILMIMNDSGYKESIGGTSKKRPSSAKSFFYQNLSGHTRFVKSSNLPFNPDFIIEFHHSYTVPYIKRSKHQELDIDLFTLLPFSKQIPFFKTSYKGLSLKNVYFFKLISLYRDIMNYTHVTKIKDIKIMNIADLFELSKKIKPAVLYKGQNHEIKEILSFSINIVKYFYATGSADIIINKKDMTFLKNCLQIKLNVSSPKKIREAILKRVFRTNNRNVSLSFYKDIYTYRIERLNNIAKYVKRIIHT